MVDSFVHLHIHSEYSLEDSILRVNDIAKAASSYQMPAVALTEMCNLFSTVKFYRAAHNKGMKPIIGSEVRILDESLKTNYRIVLLCQDLIGYQNLSSLISQAYTDGQIQGIPHINKTWLSDKTEGLICLSGGMKGDIAQAILSNNNDNIIDAVEFYKRHFPERFYLELQRTDRENEELLIANSIQIAIEHDLPVVATNDVCFLTQDDFEAHEARVCIQHGYTLNDQRRPKHYSIQQYLKSSAEMIELFQDIPEAIENTVEIAKRCNLELTLGEHYLPEFPVPENYDQSQWLIEQSRLGLEKILQRSTAELDAKKYYERLDVELDVIIQMGFPGYFLIVADFIQWAKENAIPVGPGRGSGAGSLVAYALGITDLDPLEYELLFERFLNPERVSLPDFDVDFCMDRRDEVIEYVARKYGRGHVSQIITYGSMAAKAVVRDVGRVMGFPYGFVDQLAKLIPFEIGMTLDKALAAEEALRQRYHSEDDVKSLFDLALKLEGLSRNAGKHAGGIVIAPKPLTDYMPLYCEQGSTATVSQFDMNDVESIGLVKFDFLGLRTLTIIDWAVADINKQRESQKQEPLNINEIILDDEATYQLIQKKNTTAVFQLESEGMKQLIGRLQPDKFDDLIALVALFRPGPLQSGMVDDYVERKHGRARTEYPHDDLIAILRPTHGVILYQEQVMQIAQVLAGYTLGGADLLRRAMGKKKPEEMAKQREIFTKGSVERGVDGKKATYIFDLMEKFAGYGFNKSHSAAYALVAYQTAWLKTHYPAAFMSAVLSSDMDNTEKVVMLRSEIQDMGIELLPPDINTSQHVFSVVDDKTILYGLGAVKGVGRAAIESILEEISVNGQFNSLFDFCKRVNLQKVNRRVIEASINCGAMDALGPSRSIMMASLDKAISTAEQYNQNKTTGQIDVFGFEQVSSDAATDDFIQAAEWSEDERLKREKESLGFYLFGHPIEQYRIEIEQFTQQKLKNITLGKVVIAAHVHGIRVRNTSRGKMAEVKLDDNTAIEFARIYSEPYQKYQHLLLKDQLIIINGEVENDEYTSTGRSILVNEIFSLDEYRSKYAKLLLSLKNQGAMKEQIERLKSVLMTYNHGQTPVFIAYNNGSARCQIALGHEWMVSVSDALLEMLKSDFGEDNVAISYY